MFTINYAVGTSTIEDRALLKRIPFHYGVYDEAHMLKNMTSQRYKTLVNFNVKRRLLLTGTPLQNNLLELISLLAFVMPDVFLRSTEQLKRMFQLYSKTTEQIKNDRAKQQQYSAGSSNRSQFEAEKLDQAKNLLKPFCLRRVKAEVLSQLPPKTVETIHVPMTESQSSAYWNLVGRLRRSRLAAAIAKAAEAASSSVGGEIERLDESTSDDGSGACIGVINDINSLLPGVDQLLPASGKDSHGTDSPSSADITATACNVRTVSNGLPAKKRRLETEEIKRTGSE
ncbi:unnamed protein product [Protopolystoma xenopodis]|uniref:Helicase ATP-binding domain-containing protein n=1 Tax=Protopolystoma xenopodis TaxID=117903 RepID=A0A3S5BRU6_9PLAT|nr:unnamed protein product [Protopolystoma xenopodis]